MINLSDLKNVAADFIMKAKRLNVETAISNPYKQFTYVIPNGAIETIFYQFNYFRVLNVSNSDGVTIRFGSSGTPTDVVGAGIGYELPSVVDRADIRNQSGSDVTITVACAIGRINDDRLNISGDLNVAVPSVIESIKDVTVPAATPTKILDSNINRNTIFLSPDGDNIRLGDASVAVDQGLRVFDGATTGVNNTDELYAYSVNGCTISFMDSKD